MNENHVAAVQLHRVIAAPPARVFRAWLDPAVMTRWFAPATYSCARAEVDERVGGRVSIWHRDDSGADVGGAEAQIVELVPNERIVLSWTFVGPDRIADPALATLLTITFAPTAGDSTVLELTHERLDGLRAHMPEIVSGVEPGWTSALDHLDDAVGGAR